jgi:hypothetical protein
VRDFLAASHTDEQLDIQLIHGHAALSAEFEVLRRESERLLEPGGIGVPEDSDKEARCNIVAAVENPDKLVFCLDPVVCPCSTMYRVHPAYLCWVVEQLAEGRVVNQVQVDGDTARYAKVALERMLAVG